MSNLWPVLNTLTGVAAATAGGAFVAFSSLVPAALRRLPDDRAMAVMQRMNEAAPRSPVFMTVLFAPAAAASVLAVRAVAVAGDGGSGPVVAGAVVYLVGVVATTVFFHVPRNEALARLDPARDSAGFFRWLRGWVRGNHIRSASAIVAGALLLLAEPAG